jgi:hypothetical protein
VNKKSVIVLDFTVGRAYRLSGWRLRVHEWKRRWRMRNVRFTCEGIPPRGDSGERE